MPEIEESQNNNSKVTIELSIPVYDSLPALYLNCTENNFVYVIIRNNTNKIFRFYTVDNSWGCANYSFIIKTKDTCYNLINACGGFFKNLPLDYNVLPHQSIVFRFNLQDKNCDVFYSEIHNLRKKVLRGMEVGWKGLPTKPIEEATIQIIYTPLPGAKEDGFYADTLISAPLKISVSE